MQIPVGHCPHRRKRQIVIDHGLGQGWWVALEKILPFPHETLSRQSHRVLHPRQRFLSGTFYVQIFENARHLTLPTRNCEMSDLTIDPVGRVGL